MSPQDIQLNDRVHSALYKFGKVFKVREDKVYVKWDRIGYGEGYYYKTGHSISALQSYPTLQKVENKETFTEDELEVIEKWQTKQMDIFFKIPQKS